MAVFRQPGSNTIDVVDNIKALLPFFREQMPPTVHMGLRGDRSKNIREGFQDIQFTMAATLGLVIMVIFLFLRNFSATMIPAMALPFSVVGTFAVMYLLNFSINNISMMALILSIGFVVDDAIVMLENIVRHIEHGRSRWKRRSAGRGNQLHHRLDDAFARGGLHPHSFHGGHSGPPLPRIRRHHLHRHPHLRVVSISLTPMLCSRFLRDTSHKTRTASSTASPSGSSTAC
jgi:hydrophobic/amphiphilic exporter-1 (mainly G- bacteria), HAE1 family